jgi:poly-D-alanine transfer protein DltD
MESKQTVIERAKKINEKLELVFIESGFHKMEQGKDIKGLIVIRFEANEDIHVTALGWVHLGRAVAALADADKHWDKEKGTQDGYAS